jgi:glycosyltransferase involved in cell wall biosynthesis
VDGLSVSVVIPTYNRAGLLERAVRSVLPQCRPGDEIIVVDDGSTDNTEAVARAFGAPVVRYLRVEHRGAGPARNAGIKAATSHLVAFLDSDDTWMPGKLTWQRNILEHFPEILFLFSDFAVLSDDSGELIHNYLQHWHGDKRPWDAILGPGIASTAIEGISASAPPFTLHRGRLYETLIQGWYVVTCTAIARRVEAGDALRFAEDLRTLEDYECFARLAGRGLAGYMDCETAWQHAHSGERVTGVDPATRADCAVKIIERVWGADQEYLRLHRAEYERAVDRHRLRKTRYLLGAGRREEAREELERLFDKPLSYSVLAALPGGLVSGAASVRRGLRELAPFGEA